MFHKWCNPARDSQVTLGLTCDVSTCVSQLSSLHVSQSRQKCFTDDVDTCHRGRKHVSQKMSVHDLQVTAVSRGLSGENVCRASNWSLFSFIYTTDHWPYSTFVDAWQHTGSVTRRSLKMRYLVFFAEPGQAGNTVVSTQLLAFHLLDSKVTVTAHACRNVHCFRSDFTDGRTFSDPCVSNNISSTQLCSDIWIHVSPPCCLHLTRRPTNKQKPN